MTSSLCSASNNCNIKAWLSHFFFFFKATSKFVSSFVWSLRHGHVWVQLLPQHVVKDKPLQIAISGTRQDNSRQQNSMPNANLLNIFCKVQLHKWTFKPFSPINNQSKVSNRARQPKYNQLHKSAVLMSTCHLTRSTDTLTNFEWNGKPYQKKFLVLRPY